MIKAQYDYNLALNAYTSAETAKESDDKLRDLKLARDTKLAIRDALQRVDDATKDVSKAEAAATMAMTTRADENTRRNFQLEVNQAKERLTKAKDDASRIESVGTIRTAQELGLSAVLKDI